MKETSRIVRNLLDQIEDMSDEDLLELKKFIDLDDQKMFDYILNIGISSLKISLN